MVTSPILKSDIVDINKRPHKRVTAATALIVFNTFDSSLTL